jgi:hypothetical protein
MKDSNHSLSLAFPFGSLFFFQQEALVLKLLLKT